MTGTPNHNNHSSESGFTLVEVLVSILLFSVLTAIAIGGFVSAIHTQRETALLLSSEDNVSLSIEQMAREIRTGYLFCHTPNSTQLDADCGLENNQPLGCNVQPNNGDPIWTCPTIEFYNAQDELVEYTLDSSTLMRSASLENGDVPGPLTGDDVKVDYLTFQMMGQIEGDQWPPRITIMLGVSPSSTDPAVQSTTLHFETTVSARQIDCTSGGAC